MECRYIIGDDATKRRSTPFSDDSSLIECECATHRTVAMYILYYCRLEYSENTSGFIRSENSGVYIHTCTWEIDRAWCLLHTHTHTHRHTQMAMMQHFTPHIAGRTLDMIMKSRAGRECCIAKIACMYITLTSLSRSLAAIRASPNRTTTTTTTTTSWRPPPRPPPEKLCNWWWWWWQSKVVVVHYDY